MSTNAPTRRAMLGAIVTVPVAAIPLAPTLALTATGGTDHLIANAERLEQRGRNMNRGGFSDAAWEAWSDELADAYAKIKDLPITPEHAEIRARAFVAVMEGDLEDFFQRDNSTASILVRQLIACLTGAAS